MGEDIPHDGIPKFVFGPVPTSQYDLAEAYYQLALIYQKMGGLAKNGENFAQAIALITEMQAPRQVEKVQTIIGCAQT